MIEICPNDKCTGCGACKFLCPDSINMTINSQGFFKAELKEPIGSNKNFICPQLQHVKSGKVTAYAIQNLSNKELIGSTSGGVFMLLANYVLQKNGFVAGVIYDKNMNMNYSLTNDKEIIKEMCGSKYAYVSIIELYNKIDTLLKNNTPILFVGLPCQTAGLKQAFASKLLITVDLVCTGAPSQKIFKAYIDDYNVKHNCTIVDMKFRDKQQYGLSHTTVIKYNKKGKQFIKTHKYRDDISYYRIFGKEDTYNDACYCCNYNTIDKWSDFTIGGFWNEEIIKNDFDVQKGVSLVLANNDMAREILVDIGDRMKNIQYDIKDAIVNNRGLVSNTPSSTINHSVYEDMDAHGYNYIVKKYYRNKKFYKLRKHMPKSVKLFLKKVLKK